MQKKPNHTQIYFYSNKKIKKNSRKKTSARLFPSNDNRRLREAKKSRCERREAREEMHSIRNGENETITCLCCTMYDNKPLRDVNKSSGSLSGSLSARARNCWAVSTSAIMGRRGFYAAIVNLWRSWNLIIHKLKCRKISDWDDTVRSDKTVQVTRQKMEHARGLLERILSYAGREKKEFWVWAVT